MTSDPAAAALEAAWRVIQDRWRTTEAPWRDAVRTEFEKEYWAEFENVVPAGLKETERLLDLIEAARREVGE